MNNRTKLFVAVLAAMTLLPHAITAESNAPLAWEAPTDVEIHVPAGTTQTVSRLEASVILVEGTLVHAGPDPLVLVGDRIHLAPGSQLLGQGAGGDGASIHIVASKAIHAAGTILGGDGADQPAAKTARGADGGDGGSVVLQAPSIVVYDTARLGPGKGGHGADVEVVSPDADTVQGGRGGDAGTLVFHGTPSLPPGGGALMAADGGAGGTAIVIDGSDGIWAIGGRGGDGALVATTDLEFQAPHGYTTFPVPCSVEGLCLPQGYMAPCVYLASLLNRDSGDSCGPGSNLTLCSGESADTRVDVCDPESTCPTIDDCCNMQVHLETESDIGPCSPLPCGVHFRLTAASGDEDCGNGGTDGDARCGANAICWLDLLGIEDEQNGCGDGAHGAHASNTGSSGGIGGPGAAGQDGPLFGGPGGTGGAGFAGGPGNARGADGGDGRCWFSDGGDGGDGTGTGGTGGDGGTGGTGGSGTVGGAGGTGGLCGAGGSGTGVGGNGGQPGMFGTPGKPGMGYSNPGKPGRGGEGGEGGEGFIPGPTGAGGSCGGGI